MSLYLKKNYEIIKNIIHNKTLKEIKNNFIYLLKKKKTVVK